MRADAAGNASKILDAAQRVMTTSGTWSLAQIAKAAGVAEATLYRHFPNRDALARALYAQAWNEEIAPLIGTLMDAGAPRPTLVHIGDQLVDMLARHADEIRAVDDLASATVELLTSHEENLANLVHAAHESGDLRPDFKPEDVATVFAIVAAGFTGVQASPALRRRYLSLLFDGIDPDHARPLPPLPDARDD